MNSSYLKWDMGFFLGIFFRQKGNMQARSYVSMLKK